MRSIPCDDIVLDMREWRGITLAVVLADKQTVYWNHNGELRKIPAPVLQNALDEIEMEGLITGRRPNAEVSRRAGVITLDQTIIPAVPVSPEQAPPLPRPRRPRRP